MSTQLRSSAFSRGSSAGIARHLLATGCAFVAAFAPTFGCVNGPQDSSHDESGDGDDLGSSGGTDGVAGDGDGDASNSGGYAGDGNVSASGGIGGTPDGGALVPAFVAQGHLGRTVISCDDGWTWVYDQSNDVGGGTCWSGAIEIECDHNEGAGRGLTYGDGNFFAMFGWGTASSLRRTSSGADWSVVIDPISDERYGGVAYLHGTLLAAGRSSKISTDLGETWSEPVETGMKGYNVRRAATAGEHFVIVGDADDVVISSDKGLTWFAPETLPAGCGAGVQTNGGIAFGNGKIVIVGSNGTACASSDGGVTFEQSSIGGNADSHLVWSGAHFYVYGDGTVYKSQDGVEWTSQPMDPPMNIGPIAVGPNGTFVAVKGGWGESVWYAGQAFYRSEDGIHFEALPPGNFTGGHPMRTLAFGYVSASEDCPLP